MMEPTGKPKRKRKKESKTGHFCPLRDDCKNYREKCFKCVKYSQFFIKSD